MKFVFLILIVLLAGCTNNSTNTQGLQNEIPCSQQRLPTPTGVVQKNLNIGEPYRIAVATSDINFQSGQLVVTDLSTSVVSGANQTKFSLSGDAVVRSPVGSIAYYAVNRQGQERAGSVEVISKAPLSTNQGRLGNYSVGQGSNPQDILVIDDKIAYVTRLSSKSMLKLNAVDGSGACAIDLSQNGLADDDGLPEMYRMVLVGTELWVLLQRLDSRERSFTPTDESLIAVVDTNTDTLISPPIKLTGTNPVSDLKSGPSGNLYVAEAGRYGVWDGGIDSINPATKSVNGFLLTEAQIQGDVSDFEFLDETLLVIATGSDGTMGIWSYNLSTKSLLRIPVDGAAYLSGIWRTPDNRILVSERNKNTPALHLFNGDLKELPSINLGLAPYFLTVTD